MEYEIPECKCNICKHMFVLDDKKSNGVYYKTCRSCRSKNNTHEIKNINLPTTYKCNSCHKFFNQKDHRKTCPTCLAKKNGYFYCEKCNVSCPYEKNKITCDSCSKNIDIYKTRLCNESEQYRLKLLKSNNYNDKLRFIETQLKYLYYCNSITGDITQNLRCCTTILTTRISDKVHNAKLWETIILCFEKPVHLFSDPNDFTCHDNIEIKLKTDI